MPDQLPGMPLAASDIHVCTGIGLPPPVQLHAILPTHKPNPPSIRGRWLILNLCPACLPRRYCSEHGPNNWWLTHWGR